MSNENALNAVASRDYLAFVQVCHKILRNEPLDNDRYLEYSCHIAQEFAEGNRTRVIVNMPPGFAKTTVFSICLIAWLFGHDPRLRILFASHDAPLAKEVVDAVRKIMKSDEYRRLFPARIDRGHDTVDSFKTTAGGRLFACSVRGGITGRRADVAIVDDALAIKYANKLKRIHNVNAIFDKEIMTRLSDPMGGRVIVVMHRLHDEDLTAHLMKQSGWDLIALPLVAERTRRYEYGGLVWDRAEGEQLRPGLYSKRRIRELREEDGRPEFRLLYQQGLGPQVDYALKPKHFPLLDVRQLPADLPVVFSIDASQKDGADNSQSAILVIVRIGKHDVVIDEFCSRCSYVTLYHAFQTLARKYRPSAVVIEDASNGSALIPQLQSENAFHIVPVVPRESKARRLRRHLRRIRRGRVWLKRGAAWFGDFVREFVDFPNGETDRVDALTMYLDFMSSDPVLRPAPKSPTRSLPAGVATMHGQIGPATTKPDMELPKAVLRRGRSMFDQSASTSMERPRAGGVRPGPRRDPIAIVISTAQGPMIKYI